MDRPWFQLHTRDWLDNKELRRCSPTARALLLDLMCLAHEGVPYGYLSDKLGPLTADYMASRAVMKPAVFKKALAELVDARRVTGEGATFCVPRMVRDEEIRLRRAAGGSASIGHPKTPAPKAAEGYPSKDDEGYPLSENKGYPRTHPWGYPSLQNEGGGVSHASADTRSDSDSDSSPGVGVVFSGVASGAEKPGERAVLFAGDGWEEYIGVFLAAGKQLNEQDLSDACRFWVSLSDVDRRLAFTNIQATAATRNAEFIPFPVNHLKKKPWTRRGPQRRTPEPGESRTDRVQREAAEEFLREGK